MATGKVDSKTPHPHVSLGQRGHYMGPTRACRGVCEGNFDWSFSVTLPSAHQAKWRRCAGRRDFKVLLISSLEYFLMLVISPNALCGRGSSPQGQNLIH